MNSGQKEIRQKEIVETLFTNAGRVLFGTASVELKMHEGRCVAITYSTTENTRQKETGEQLNVPTSYAYLSMNKQRRLL
jgi:hypothetical protein